LERYDSACDLDKTFQDNYFLERDFIRNQSSSAAKTKHLGYLYYYELGNGLDGIQELMKNLWLIKDNPKIEVKERMKAMNLIMQCYYMTSKLIDSEAFNKEFLDYTKKVQSDEEALRIREQEISRREKSLERKL
jgi:hypothetical protein